MKTSIRTFATLLLALLAGAFIACSESDEPTPAPEPDARTLPDIRQMLSDGYWAPNDQVIIDTDSLFRLWDLYRGLYPGGDEIIGGSADHLLQTFRMESSGLISMYRTINITGTYEFIERYEESLSMDIFQKENVCRIRIEPVDSTLRDLWCNGLEFIVSSVEEGKLVLIAEITDDLYTSLAAEWNIAPVVDRITALRSVWTRVNNPGRIEKLESAIPWWAWHMDPLTGEIIVDPF